MGIFTVEFAKLHMHKHFLAVQGCLEASSGKLLVVEQVLCTPMWPNKACFVGVFKLPCGFLLLQCLLVQCFIKAAETGQCISYGCKTLSSLHHESAVRLPQ